MGTVQSYFLYYFIIIFSSVIVSLSENVRKKNISKFHWVIFWAAILLPIFISGARYGIGTDYIAYETIYLKLTQAGIIENLLNTRYEPGWIFLNHLVDFIFGDVKYIFILSSIVLWVFMFKGIYQHKDNINLSIAMLILLTTIYNMSFNNIRQTLAMSIVLLSFKFIIENKQIKFIIMTLFAALFHYTALILLPVYWLVNGKSENFNRMKKFIGYTLMILLVIFAEPVISLITSIDIFSEYGSYDVGLDEIGFRSFILKIPIIIIILLNTKKLKEKQNPLYKLTTLYFIGIILEFLRYFAPHLERVSLYFEMTQILIIPAMINAQNNKYIKFLLTMGIILYYLILFTYQIIISNNSETIPYSWWIW